MKTSDVIIIGAGVVGCSVALSLARRGISSINIDTLPAPGYGSTSHSSAIIRPFYSHITACAVAHESRHRWLDWQAFLDAKDPQGIARYDETGGVVLVAQGSAELYEKNIAALDAVGVAYEWLDEDALTEMYPNICLDGFAPPKRMHDSNFGSTNKHRINKGIWMPACGHVNDPQLAAHNLYHAAQSAGATFLFNSQVKQISQSAGRITGIVLANSEQIMAPVVVNAAGPHSGVINTMAGISHTFGIATHPMRHEVAYVKAPQSFAKQQGFLVDLDTGIYQRGDGKDLLIGSADPACDPPDIVDPNDYNSELTEQWTQQVYRAALRLPDVAIENTARGTVGLYDVSADWIPIYDSTDLDGFFVAIGTSGNQFKNAPVVGDIMATLITSTSAVDVSLALPAVNRSVDLSFYSRLREPQSTNGVMA